jgi:hypothetical protein
MVKRSVVILLLSLYTFARFSMLSGRAFRLGVVRPKR